MADRIPGVCVFGVGGAGLRIVGALSKLTASRAMRLIAADTDEAALKECPIAGENKLLAAAAWRNGRGCGGNAVSGKSSFSRERENLRNLIGEPELLLVIAGLGGGTGTGGLGIILSECRKKGFPTLFLLTLPFTLEGHSRMKLAEEALQSELLPLADAVVTLPNDLLFSVLPSTTPLSEAFKMADQETARTAVALSAVLRYGNLLSASFADLSELLKKRKSFCSIGCGSASGENRGPAALEKMLSSPLCGGLEKIKNSDAILFSLLGGPDLNIGETRQILEYASSLAGPNCQILISTGNMADMGNEIHLCGIFIKFDNLSPDLNEVRERPVDDFAPAARHHRERKHKTAAGGNELLSSAASGRETGSGEVEQLTLFLETHTKGEMEGTIPVLYNGEDLDIPVFLRRKISINKGSTE